MFINYEEYSTDNLTAKQYEYILGMQSAIEMVSDEICDYCIDPEDRDVGVIDKMRCEIAQEVLVDLREKIEDGMMEMVVTMSDENACNVMNMSRKKAEKKYGKKFVREVLDE